MYALKDANGMIIMTDTLNRCLEEQTIRNLREEDTRIEKI